MSREKIHFITGKLAEPALRSALARLAPQVGFEYTVDVLPISVAALMTIKWIAPRLHAPTATARVVLPGYCHGDLDELAAQTGCPVERGPREIAGLDDFFGMTPQAADLSGYDIEIIAEINHAPRLPLTEILRIAKHYTDNGADIIDIGCDIGQAWSDVGRCARALREEGHRVSIDSLDPREIEPAIAAGAELVLSVNSANREAARDWPCEVVAIPDAIPDTPDDLESLAATLEILDTAGVKHRIDPILEPIGVGLAASFERYAACRRRWPDEEMMMGIGNLTELTSVDSAGVNFLLLGVCQELGVRSVLTTEVINWARTSVRECDLARRQTYWTAQHHAAPKWLSNDLIMLRDAQLPPREPEELNQLALAIKDHNVRIFVEQGRLRVMSAGVDLEGDDAFVLFDALREQMGERIDSAHAFYLGYELAKAATALTLGKQYTQDEALDWGFLSVAETTHRLARHGRRATKPNDVAKTDNDEWSDAT